MNPNDPHGDLPPELPVSAASAAAEEIDALAIAAALRTEIGKALIGQHETIEEILAAFLAGGHVLIEGVPGLGKTLLVLALARAIGGTFSRVQFTPDLMPSDVTGHAMYDTAAGAFRIRRGPVFANLLLADEINRAPAKTQAALLELMQEQQVTLEGESLPLPQPFMTLATQNPIEHEGTYPLPEAQLDRFLVQVRMDYPQETEEVAIVQAVTGDRVGNGLDVEAVQPAITVAGARALQARIATTLVDERIAAYAVRLVRATRTRRGVAFGAGPRGAIALVRIARARAVLAGRDFVLPDDIKAAALPALRHRVVLAPELEVEGLQSDDVLSAVVESVEAPRA